MRATRIQPLTVNGGNINRLRKKIYNMFADLVPSKNYKYHSTGNVIYGSLPFYQCGGSDATGRTFAIKEYRFPTKDETIAFEMIAQALKSEGVSIMQRDNQVTGLRLMYKPRTKNQPKPAYTAPDNAYKTEDNNEPSLPFINHQFNNKEMYVVVKKDNSMHFMLSRQEIEKNINQDSDYLETVSIYKIGDQVEPKVKMMVNF